MTNNHEMPPEIVKAETGVVTVRELLQDPAVGLDLELLQGQEGLENKIRSPRIQKLGMTLAGFSGYIHPERVQFVGSSEIRYLQTLEPEACVAAVRGIRHQNICCILVTKGLDVPEEFLRVSGEEKIPVLRCSALSSLSIARVSSYLEKRLAPRMTIHGVLMEIFGLGVLILGPSGIGKSECALDLVLRGHSLITDDYVELTRRSIDKLTGEGGKILKHHMELRGLGIIDIKELFGVSATSLSQNVDIAVRLEHWNSEADYDRLGLDHSTIEYLGVSIPLIAMPVAPGRNIAALVEVAARLHMLRQRERIDD